MSWHARQSAHNQGAQRYLSESSQYMDWEITALFYSVVHVIDEYLASIGKKPHSHDERRTLVRENLRHIYRDYRSLYILCRKVRYTIVFGSVKKKHKQKAVRLHNSICANIRPPT